MEDNQPKREMTAEEKLHAFRKQIDACIKQSYYLKGGDRNAEVDPTQFLISNKAGREMALVYTKLQEAKMWAGKCLEMLGSQLPAQYTDEAK
jgi:hypothetical protein